MASSHAVSVSSEPKALEAFEPAFIFVSSEG